MQLDAWLQKLTSMIFLLLSLTNLFLFYWYLSDGSRTKSSGFESSQVPFGDVFPPHFLRRTSGHFRDLIQLNTVYEVGTSVSVIVGLISPPRDYNPAKVRVSLASQRKFTHCGYVVSRGKY